MRQDRSLIALSMAAGIAASVALAVLAPAPALSKEADVAAAVEKIEEYARETFEQKRRESAIRALGKIGGEEAAAALLPLMDDPYVHIRDHVGQAWSKMLVGERAAETRTWVLAKGLRDRRAHVRAALWAALGRAQYAGDGPRDSNLAGDSDLAGESDLAPDSDLADALRRHARSEKDGVALRALAETSLALSPDPALAGVLLPRLAHKDGAAVHAVARAVARHGGRAAVIPLGRLLKPRDPLARDPLARAGAVVALQGLDALTSEQTAAILADAAAAPRMALAETLHLGTQALAWPGDAESVLDALLVADDWRVRAAAVQAALRLWEPGIVPRLVARLGLEDGRLKDDVQRALETYTGHETDPDPDLWRAWWAAQQEGFDAGERPALDAAGRVPFAPASRGVQAGGTVSFFDVPLYSKKLLFIFDLSGSLGNPAHDGEDAPTKLELLQDEVRTTLDLLSDDVSFDLCVYRYWSGYPPKPEMTRAFGALRPAQKRNVAKAKEWLADQEAKGWGAFVEPLEECYAEDVDTAVLLSDGRPSRGRYERDFRILAEFPTLNRYRALAVNTVLIGAKGADEKFMRRLASLTGGRFSERR